MNDVYVASLTSAMIEAIESFTFYQNMSDHVMYRAKAAQILELANELMNEVEE